MAKDRYLQRRDRLLSKLKKTGVKTLLVTDLSNVTYLTGFSGDSSYLLLGQGITILLSDTRYDTQLKEECPGLNAYIRNSKQSMGDVLADHIEKAGLSQLAIESHVMTVEESENLSTKVRQVELVATSGLVEELRMIKDAHEIGEIREAVRIAERGFSCLKSALVGGATELQVAHDLEHSMRRFGAERAAFEPIVAVGPRAALPHARPGKNHINESPILLVDWGAETTSGYKSDLTRVLVTGKVLPKLEKIYGVVLKAQLRAIDAIRPGAKASQVDRVARSIIEKAGFGKQFGHGLGHGFGLDIHEEPRMSPISKWELKPGMVITVEPGIYIPGWGGVRIEDDVLVTRDGHEVLTSVPKNFDESIVAI